MNIQNYHSHTLKKPQKLLTVNGVAPHSVSNSRAAVQAQSTGTQRAPSPFLMTVLSSTAAVTAISAYNCCRQFPAPLYCRKRGITVPRKFSRWNVPPRQPSSTIRCEGLKNLSAVRSRLSRQPNQRPKVPRQSVRACQEHVPAA